MLVDGQAKPDVLGNVKTTLSSSLTGRARLEAIKRFRRHADSQGSGEMVRDNVAAGIDGSLNRLGLSSKLAGNCLKRSIQRGRARLRRLARAPAGRDVRGEEQEPGGQV